MDSRNGASEQPNWHTRADWSLDWAQDKDLEKNTRYGFYLLAITEKGRKMDYSPIQLYAQYQRLRNRGRLGGQIHEIMSRQKKNPYCHHPQNIRAVRRDLWQFHVATHTSLEWAQHALADNIPYTTTRTL